MEVWTKAPDTIQPLKSCWGISIQGYFHAKQFKLARKKPDDEKISFWDCDCEWWKTTQT